MQCFVDSIPKVIIVHGWEGSSRSDWIPWLASELRNRGITVAAPDMPNTTAPVINDWVAHLSKLAYGINQDTYFVGHSIGCQAVVRYLQGLSPDQKAGGAVFVAPWTKLEKANYTPQEMETIEPWKETPINWPSVKMHANYFVCIYSDNDQFVSRKSAEEFGNSLRAKMILENNMGHFSTEDGTTQLPVARDELLAIMGMPVDI